MARTPQTAGELERHLGEQIHFLKSSANAYDAGYEAEAKRMAVVLRVLLHDGDRAGSNSRSLLGLLGRKGSTKFYDSAVFKGTALNLGASLVVIPAGGTGKAIPFLDHSPPDTVGYTDFDEYWNKPVLYAKGKHFTRKELVLFVADQDGGAHVDRGLDEEYARLSRDNSFGWRVGSSGSADMPVTIVELATIRQIAHEILRTLVPDYPKKMLTQKVPLMYPRIFIENVTEEDPTDPSQMESSKSDT